MKVWPWDRFAPQIASEHDTGPAGWSAIGRAGARLAPAATSRTASRACRRSARRSATAIDDRHRGTLALGPELRAPDRPRAGALRRNWMEDSAADSVDDLARLARESRVPQAVSERLIGSWAYRDVLEAAAAQLVMVDVIWTGGITEARQDRHAGRRLPPPVAPHDCTARSTSSRRRCSLRRTRRTRR